MPKWLIFRGHFYSKPAIRCICFYRVAATDPLTDKIDLKLPIALWTYFNVFACLHNVYNNAIYLDYS